MGRVVVIHPDLGIGGAERLIVDASKALQEQGHEVTIYTGYHNVERCFEETRNGTLKTVPIGQWIPRTIFGRCYALMAYLKMIYIAVYLLITLPSVDIILCDQVSACIPFLKLNHIGKRRSKIVFYCHFPDQLLTQRNSLMKTIYRKPLDKFEEWSTSLADCILVNSKFTKNIVQRTFPLVRKRELTVLYPCVDVDFFLKHKPSEKDCDIIYSRYKKLSKNQFVFLSLNRFERKKGLTSAIEALSGCLFKLKHEQDTLNLNTSNKKQGMHLLIAGGYDPRLQDCVTYHTELVQLVKDLDIENHVTFIQSPSDEDKFKLLKLCDVVVYTPENEHFGIVPIEAMAMSKPVIASASGGPLETIEDKFNGYLCARDDDSSFLNAMIKCYSNQENCDRMGANGFKRVIERFSYGAFRDNLGRICFSQE